MVDNDNTVHNDNNNDDRSTTSLPSHATCSMHGHEISNHACTSPSEFHCRFRHLWNTWKRTILERHDGSNCFFRRRAVLLPLLCRAAIRAFSTNKFEGDEYILWVVAVIVGSSHKQWRCTYIRIQVMDTTWRKPASMG